MTEHKKSATPIIAAITVLAGGGAVAVVSWLRADDTLSQITAGCLTIAVVGAALLAYLVLDRHIAQGRYSPPKLGIRHHLLGLPPHRPKQNRPRTTDVVSVFVQKSATPIIAAITVLAGGGAVAVVSWLRADDTLSQITAGCLTIAVVGAALLAYLVLDRHIAQGRYSPPKLGIRHHLLGLPPHRPKQNRPRTTDVVSVFVLLGALLLGPTCLNAVEVRTWSLAVSKSEAVTPLPSVSCVTPNGGLTTAQDVGDCITSIMIAIGAGSRY